VAESIASEVAESVVATQAQKEQGVPASPPDDLDELFAELEGSPEPTPAEQNVEAKASSADVVLENLSSEADDTLSELDALIDDIMSPADTAPVDTVLASSPAQAPAADPVEAKLQAPLASDTPKAEDVEATIEIVAEAEIASEQPAATPAAEAVEIEALEEEPAQAEDAPVAKTQAAPNASEVLDMPEPAKKFSKCSRSAASAN
jgi:hypothetical protein